MDIWPEGGSCHVVPDSTRSPWAMQAKEEFAYRLRPDWDLVEEHGSEDGAR